MLSARGKVALAGLLGVGAGCSFTLDFDGYSVRADVDQDAGGSRDAGPEPTQVVSTSARPQFHNYRFERGEASFRVGAAEGLLAGVASEEDVAAGSFSSRAGGAVELVADGSFQYTPPGAAGAFWGDDYFEFGLLGSANTGRVRVTIPPVTFELAELAGNPHGGFGVAGAQALDQAGGYADVEAAGDVNGDGLEDFLVGALGPGATALRWGLDYGPGRSVHVVFGKRDTDNVNLAEISAGNSAAGFVVLGDGNDDTPDSFGAVAAAAGDVNGDGLDDIIIGASTYSPLFDVPGFDPSQLSEFEAYGAAYVVFGKRDGVPVRSTDLRAGRGGGFAILSPGGFVNYLGASVHAAGDVNGDGLADVIVGTLTVAEDSHGAAYVVLGKVGPEPVALSELALGGPLGFPIEGTPEDVGFGTSVTGVGDLNGDGLDDVAAVGPAYSSAAEQFTGRGVVVYGRRETTPVGVADVLRDPALGFTFVGGDAEDELGLVTSLGDFNGDGLDDLIVGAPLASLVDPAPADAGAPDPTSDAGAPDAGASPPATDAPVGPTMGMVYALLGAPTAEPVQLRDIENGVGPGVAFAGTQRQEYLGYELSAGDLNSDGLGDLLLTTLGSGLRSESYLVFGSHSPQPVGLGPGTQSSSALLVLRATGPEAAGTQIRSGADFNGDGIDDLLFSAPIYTDAPQNAGGAYVVFGWDMTGALSGRDAALIGTSGDDSFDLPRAPVVIVRGGHGIDTLRAADGPAQIDLTLPGRYESIEVIDVRGGGPQTLLLDDAALRRIPGNQTGYAFSLARRLTVLGDSEDTLVFDLRGYQTRGSGSGRVVYGREGYHYGIEVSQGLQLQAP